MNKVTSGVVAALAIALAPLAPAMPIHLNSGRVESTPGPRRTLSAHGAGADWDNFCKLWAFDEHGSPALAAFGLGNGAGNSSWSTDEPVMAVVRKIRHSDQSFLRNDVVRVRNFPPGAGVLADKDLRDPRQNVRGASVPEGGTTVVFLAAALGGLRLMRRKLLDPHP